MLISGTKLLSKMGISKSALQLKRNFTLCFLKTKMISMVQYKWRIKISDQISGVIVCQQKTDSKQLTWPCGLGLKFCFSADNVFWNSCIFLETERKPFRVFSSLIALNNAKHKIVTQGLLLSLITKLSAEWEILAILLSSLTDDFLAILPNHESLLTLFPSEFLAPLSSNCSAVCITKSEAKP